MIFAARALSKQDLPPTVMKAATEAHHGIQKSCRPRNETVATKFFRGPCKVLSKTRQQPPTSAKYVGRYLRKHTLRTFPPGVDKKRSHQVRDHARGGWCEGVVNRRKAGEVTSLLQAVARHVLLSSPEHVKHLQQLIEGPALMVQKPESLASVLSCIQSTWKPSSTQ